MNKLVTFLFILALTFSTYSYADQEAELVQEIDFEKAWNAALRNTETLKERGNCYKLWGSFRGLASWNTPYKYKARRAIYNHLLPNNSSEQALIPSIHNGESTITRLRFATIIAVHSKPGKIINDRYPPIELIERFLPGTKAKQEFIACVRQDPDADCSDILVAVNEVPSYENFYAENQRLYLQGQGSKCGAQLEINLGKEDELKK